MKMPKKKSNMPHMPRIPFVEGKENANSSFGMPHAAFLTSISLVVKKIGFSRCRSPTPQTMDIFKSLLDHSICQLILESFNLGFVYINPTQVFLNLFSKIR